MVNIFPHAYMGNGLVPLAQANLSIASSAVLYGLSVYTVFPLCVTSNGLAAFRLRDHYNRLEQSAHIIGIDTFASTWTFQRFASAVDELVKANTVKEDALVRASIHVDALLPGTRSRGLPTTLSLFIYQAPPIVPQNGARLKTSVWRRVPDYAIPSRAKVNGAYVNSVLAKQDALDSKYDDCLFLDTQGHVCEASAANVFLVRDGVLITPSTSHDLLEGINRRTVLELAADIGIPTREQEVDLTELYIASEMFLSGTSSLIAPVTEVDARRIGTGKPGPITLQLRQALDDLLHGRGRHPEWLTIVRE